MLHTYLKRISLRGLATFCIAAIVGLAGNLLLTSRTGDTCEQPAGGGQTLEDVQVLCMVITTPENHRSKAVAVKETWGQRCTDLLFFSSQLDLMLPTVALNVSEGKEPLWNKTKAALRYMWSRGLMRRNQWLLTTDDDTYMVMEDLRRILQPLDSGEALYLGLHPTSNLRQGYISGGAGFVLSRVALKRLMAAWELGKDPKAGNDLGFEDINIGWWMERVGATFVQTADASGRRHFHSYPPSREMSPDSAMLGVSENYEQGGEDVRTTNGCEADTRDCARSAWIPDFRFQASLWWDRDESPLCGAAVIDERNLVTASHCIFEGLMRPTRRPINFLRITVGSSDYQKADSYEVGYTYTHPYFYMNGMDNDIAVVRLKKPMKLGEGVRSIPLATSAPSPGTVCQLSGWGSWANRDDMNATTLRHMDVVVQTHDKCLGTRDGDVTTPLICVAPRNGDAYTHADDGGPLTCSGQLAGVIIRNGRKGLGVAATAVPLHEDFLAESVAHPGRGAWPFVTSLLAGIAEAATCLAATVVLARVSDAW